MATAIPVRHSSIGITSLHKKQERRLIPSSAFCSNNSHGNRVSLLLLAGLIAYRAARLAGGLAGGLALTAATLFHGLLKSLRI